MADPTRSLSVTLTETEHLNLGALERWFAPDPGPARMSLADLFPDATLPATQVSGAAMAYEFGDANTPARPFIRPTVDARRSAYGVVAEGLVGAVIEGRITRRDAQAQMARRMRDDIQHTIATKNITIP